MDYIIINNNTITEKQPIVDQFNSYFCNIAYEMANNITIPLTGSYKDYLTNKFHASFSFKSFDKFDIFDIHRIINNLSSKIALGMIFEKVVFIQLYDFFSENNFLNPSQYGFRKKHSTELAALETVDILLNKLDNKQTPAAIFIELSKAFDTIDHQILLNKLSYYGIKKLL